METSCIAQPSDLLGNVGAESCDLSRNYQEVGGVGAGGGGGGMDGWMDVTICSNDFLWCCEIRPQWGGNRILRTLPLWTVHVCVCVF